MSESVEQTTQTLIDFVAMYGLQVLAAIIILIVGFWLAGFAKRKSHKLLMKSPNADEMLAGFISAIIKYVVMAVTFLAVLNKFGVETTSLIAVLGAAGLAIGLALQGTLSNVAAGVMLLFLRPFKVGHFVEVGGQSGVIKGVSLFTTEMATGDNVQIIMPNSQVWGSAIKNFSAHDTRRVDLVMGISYEDDMDQAMATIEALAKADDRIKQDPAPVLAIGELADSSVNITVRLWVNASDYWGVRWDITKKVKETFDEKGISIPYPQQVVHHVKEG
ncbi:Small-conductance mechanosensitive channel [Candidatus Terasakiella magnetica]|uniref:Small-conductance mechanosensitive channel n=1 Tax=Candidatus Terasakiella magnetica TaxID=1867952 RepID=A0A1C3RIG9_9PROT|nr:mechanosensitive ion channel domain-containing protein [Candidatus Terasakiella magnetica]SCA57014.1 Small-conductance mechanosensitive channel [Candidatus Terasakiella magnetica]